MTIQQASTLVIPLRDASATLEQVGGKGASLARMVAAGLPVPPGFCVSTAAYRRFVAENGLQPRILAAVASANPDRPATLDAAAGEIGRLFAVSPMPEEIAAAIRRGYANLGASLRGGGADELAVAVRSSATAEDLPELSFAGQQETYLNVRGAHSVLDAVKRCWASLWTARAIGYRARHGIDTNSVSLAVVVQELVPAEASGVLFTANPVTGARDQMVINAAWGLGEAIVGGQVTPDTLVVAKSTGRILDEQVSQKDVMTVRTPEGTREEPVPVDRQRLPVLTAAQVARLAALGERVEQLYGAPMDIEMDIEWALAEGRFFIVQARPITALPSTRTPSGESASATPEPVWPLPNPKGRYARSSVFELLPDPLSPLFETLGLGAWSRAMSSFFTQAGISSRFPFLELATINGYGYYDVTMSPGQITQFLLGTPRITVAFTRLMRSSRARWRDARARYAEMVTHWQDFDLKSVPAEELLRGVETIAHEAADYYLTIQGGILPAAYMSEALFTQVYNRLLKRPADPPALTFMLGFESEPLRAEQSLYDLARWASERPELASQLARMSSEQFAAAYRGHMARRTTNTQTGTDTEWEAFWQRLDAHLARYGHTIYDLDFAKPVLAENPTALFETLKYFLSGSAPNPSMRLTEAAARRERGTRRMLIQLRGPRRSLFKRLLGVAQRFAPLREDALADVGLGWPILRRMLRDLGQRLVATGVIDTPDDVYWLSLGNLQADTRALDAGHRVERAQAIVAARRATWEHERTLTPPSALPVKGGARFLGFDFSAMLPANTGQAAGNVLKGIGASPGRVTGRARVIYGPEEFDQMRQGDILVARITTPAWTPLFALASGVVTDVGGPLSHSSIVAREYHIPAVLGTGEATERIRSGGTIVVDGDAGTVRISGD
ncbi:MAG TPA: PEP/pyruvate-binding domain-containing protein [Ktedonobacterales bacterium]